MRCGVSTRRENTVGGAESPRFARAEEHERRGCVGGVAAAEWRRRGDIWRW